MVITTGVRFVYNTSTKKGFNTYNHAEFELLEAHILGMHLLDI